MVTVSKFHRHPSGTLQQVHDAFLDGKNYKTATHARKAIASRKSGLYTYVISENGQEIDVIRTTDKTGK